ncbi:Signal recognition particle receptor subunit beta, a GTPase [Actinacidiphila yanglinensis]|uniref:Signal recognition particle receptor subunit beta, a GTPase n=1 Tax=Actinacidiphila yanglinensis TaxID=310779 RepID=A0A1H5VS59_9ACTN|nr:ATP/GTP-binding protein [Actinacidiphila yanglinensis]SEF89357.1 Signal recognition particle receptor subunit beta, a GTPase [Actinacidiphila yanglinensis]
MASAPSPDPGPSGGGTALSGGTDLPGPHDTAPDLGFEYHPPTVTRSAKLLITGPFGVGKTTLVGAVAPLVLRMDESMTEASVGVDDLRGTPQKTTTTVAMDFGRLHLNESLVLYLFGTPGQARFRPLWEGLADGALGALVLVDTRDLDHSHDVLDLLEEYGTPYAVAINRFDDAVEYPLDEVRQALDLDGSTPLTVCDARDRDSCVRALITLVEYLSARQLESRP